jgi:mycothiol synthase
VDATVSVMVEIRSAHPVAPEDLDAIRSLHAAATRADGHDALGAAVWRDLETGGQPGAAGVFATDDDRLVGYAHVMPSDNFSPPHWSAGLVVDPSRRDGPITVDLLEGIVEHVERSGTGEIVLWIFDPADADEEHTAAAQFTPSRDLLQMRVALPLDEVARWPAGITVRGFIPGTDETAWLDVNNRAFGNHPEQGGWIASTLERRIAEPWFDPDGFLLAWSGEEPPRLAGFCWTKIHPPGSDNPGAGDVGLGEIFVIGVDPDHQGTGLGRALVVAGLESLAGRGARTGLLYVDGANTPAVGLYEALGFTVHRRDRAYRREVR